MTLLISHPQREQICTQLAKNIVLRTLKPRAFTELEKHLTITEHKKGDLLLGQGDHEMAQYFILDGILKRVVANQEGKEMILRFSKEDDMDTSYAAWRLRTPAPYTIRAVVKCRVAQVPMEVWVEFLEKHPRYEAILRNIISQYMRFDAEQSRLLRITSARERYETLAKTRPNIIQRIPLKFVASYLSISQETLSRVRAGKL